METYDNRTLYIFTNGLEEKEIVNSIAKAIQYYEKETGDEIHTFFRVNMVKNLNREPLGYAWLYVTNPKLYHLLSGNNPDGTERIEIINQENFIPPSLPFEELWKEQYEKEKKRYDPNDWALFSLEDEVKSRVSKMYQCPKVEVKLPPLIKIPSVLKEGKEITINISRGKLCYPDSFYFTNQLKNSSYSKIPSWLDRSTLYDIFRPYVTDDNFIYPKIRVLTDKNGEKNTTVFIEYNPNSTDALSAINMLKKIYLVDPEGNEQIFSFNFSQRNKHNYN